MDGKQVLKGNVRFGIVGIHGYSRSHIGQIRTARAQGHPLEPSVIMAYMREKNEPFAAELEAEGIKLVDDYEELLGMKDEIDCITLPVGIPLHRTMGVRALQAGFPVYIEKPVAGAIQDADALGKAEEETGKKLFIGYQACFQPVNWEVKKRLLAGEAGTVKRIVAVSAYPRKKSYFVRNGWAGKLSKDGVIVLDSPLNNACAHSMNLALFLAGGGLDVSALPETVEAETYRVNDIESADTLAVRVFTAEGVEIVWVASHSCQNSWGPRLRVEGSKKTLTVSQEIQGGQKWMDITGGGENVFAEGGEKPVSPFLQVARWFNGEKDVPLCDLKIARAQTVVVNGVHKAAKIYDIEKKHIEEENFEGGEVMMKVKGMDEVLNSCYEKGCLLNETDIAPWSVSPLKTDVRNLDFFKLD